MRLSKGLASMFAATLMTASAWAAVWVPSWDHGAYVESVKYGAELNEEYPYFYEAKLKVSLQNTAEFTLNSMLQYQLGADMYQALLKAKADSMPVLLLVDTTNNTFSEILIGTINPDHPVSLRMPRTSESRQGWGAPGFDLLGRTRTPATARVPLLNRPVPAR